MFEPINHALLGIVGEEVGFACWCGLRSVAADDSHVRLTLFDPKRRVRCIQEAVAFGLFLPGIELFSRFALYEPACVERRMLIEFLDVLAPNGLLLLDPGYPGAWLVAFLFARKVSFCICCDIEDNGFKAVRQFIPSVCREAIVTAPWRDLADQAHVQGLSRAFVIGRITGVGSGQSSRGHTMVPCSRWAGTAVRTATEHSAGRAPAQHCGSRQFR